MRVRTSGGALAAGAVVAGVLSLVTVGDGSSPKPVTRESLQAAPLPEGGLRPMQPDPRLPSFHRDGEAPREPPGPPPPPPEPQREILEAVSSPDALVFQAVRGALTYLALFLLGHLTLRRYGVGGRWAYAGLGSVAALITVASQTPLQGWRNLIVLGNLSYFLAIPIVAGLIMGFSYRWRAGLEADGDDPAVLEATLAAAQTKVEPALVDTGDAEYFSGPVQVRTSFPVAFVAALLSSGLFGLISMAFAIPAEVQGWMASGQQMPLNKMVALAIQSQLHVILLMGLMAPLPFAALVMLGQVLLRAIGKTSYRAYLVAGATAPLLLTLLLGPVGFLLGLRAAVPMAVAMCVYRSMAGLEPKAVKEDIEVRDRRNLMDADHPRRRYSRVIKA
ncbi:hypothetical protein [Phenylobacterium sp.]|uniref:hypothetical protein n=1 Tax=Phenylobacterium sp. TaxID=1871053 RepID=UPI002ED96946